MENSTVLISRKIHFCSGHRVMNHESKCATLHGHNYIAWFYARRKAGLDEIGRVVDFSVLKNKIGNWIDNFWDHNTIVYQKDTELIKMLKSIPRRKEPFILMTNPTAENMADYLLNVVCDYLFKTDNFKVFKVVLFETENCFAEVSL